MLALLVDEGDPFLVEEFTYSHILESVAEPKGYVPVGVPMDRHGMRPDALRQVRGHAAHASLSEALRRVFTHKSHFPRGLLTIKCRSSALPDAAGQ